jgi:alkylation response protein AidB-like acyl-CoA dehydrogenase
MSSSARIGEAALREDLLTRVAGIRDLLADTAPASEAARVLVPEAVHALSQAGLMRMNVPLELGGWEAAPATQMEVLAALAEIDTAAGWVTMVSNNSAGFMGAFVPDAGVDDVFAGGSVPICSGVAAPSGTATAMDGGFALSGYWRLCSGVHHSSWLRLTAAVDGNPEQRLFAVVPQSAVEIHDTWHVLGLRATGAGTVALYQPNIFERLLRDIHAVTQHVMVQDVNYAHLGARRLAAAGASD